LEADKIYTAKTGKNPDKQHYIGISFKKVEDNEEKGECKITTPEKAAEMTRDRRKEFGLGEKKELTPEEKEKTEADIQELLDILYGYDYDSLDEKTQEDWYWAEQEVAAGKDCELAKANLERLVKFLQEKD